MHRAIRLGLVRVSLLATALLGNSAEAASFNCRQAQLPAERTICGDDNLGRLDEQTTGLYFLILGSDGPGDIIAEVRATQKAFLRSRNACGSASDCLIDAYTSRMMMLKNIKDDLGL